MQITLQFKMPVFSFEKIRGAETSLGPEMKSTGECLGIAKTFNEALTRHSLEQELFFQNIRRLLFLLRMLISRKLFHLHRDLKSLDMKFMLQEVQQMYYVRMV
mgnify:FL=1